MEIRYQSNIDSILTEENQITLLEKTISVIGCGGNGGYILEFLTRLGVKSIYFWDGDCYDESNLNRQVSCTEKTIGTNKADTILQYLQKINSSIKLNSRNWYFGEKNEDLIDVLNSDLIIMAADDSYNISQTREIIRLAIEQGVPCIDEFLNGLGGEISIITNKDFTIWDTNSLIWEQNKDIPKEQLLNSQPAYKCALVAAETINQMVQYFSGIPYCADHQKLIIDMYHHKYTKIDKYGTI